MKATPAPVRSPEQMRALRREANRLLGPAAVDQLSALAADRGQFVALDALTTSILGMLDDRARSADHEALLRLAVKAEDLFVDVHERANSHHLQLHQQVREGLSRLRGISCTAELLDHVCGELVRSCGVHRAVLSRIEDGVWYPWMAHFDGDPELQRSFVEMLRDTTIDLATAPVESAVAASHAPRIVHNAGGEHAYGPIIGPSLSTSYVVAPLTSAGRVIGLLHADNYPDRAMVDEVDRDVVWAFADGVARIYERTELAERLQGQRRQVEATFRRLESITELINSEDIVLSRDPSARTARSVGGMRPIEADPTIDALLTEREREVLGLMVLGRSNSAIAERLVIREGTVKSHVKHILRKLGAVNRAEVIALSLGRTQIRE